MFETIGHTPDPEANQRAAWAASSTMLLAGVFSAVLATTGLGAASRLQARLDESTEMVEIVLTEPAPLSPLELPEAPPAAPEPPAAQPAADPEPTSPEAVPADDPAADEAPDDPTPLDQLAEERELAYARASTAQPGNAAGSPTAPGGGQHPDPTEGAAPDDSGPDTLTVQSRVQPEYPNLARNIGLLYAECTCTVGIQRNGVPFSVEVEGCSKIFHGSARRALLGWRWNPVPENLSDPVFTKIAVHFDRR